MKEKNENIKLLLDKYLEGETTLQEEQLLRKYFTSQQKDAAFAEWAPIFQCFDNEREEKTVKQAIQWGDRMRFAIVAAAGVALLAGTMFYSVEKPDIIPDYGCTGSYVKIEGTCYNDPILVLSQAAQAISELDILLAEESPTVLNSKDQSK
jgi:hypothetical protein